MTDSSAAASPIPDRSRFVVGMDLGTTNSAVAYVDTHESPWRIRTFPIPQIVAPNQIEARETLPSFLYQPAKGEFPANSFRLPWRHADANAFVGFLARDHGIATAGRVIASAKSWLCHSGVDRNAPLLPWQGSEDVPRLSPVAVSSKYLQHVREAWDHKFPAFPLVEQDFVLTLPASFDEVARELTVKAGQQAGLRRILLIEEPQAAFYAWLAKQHDRWEERVAAGQKILVVDVGGGTSDFTLIRVRKGSDGTIQFHRVAVGQHLILGGDNLDLALAGFIERKLKGDDHLEPRQWQILLRTCREVKEVLLGENPPEKMTVHLPGAGSRLIGGGLQVTVTREDVHQLLVDGYFPQVPLASKPATARYGLQEFGLPYAADPAVTKHLASFLSTHRHAGTNPADLRDDPVVYGTSKDPARPDILLFNGGVFASPQLKSRIVESLQSWFHGDGVDWSPEVLDHERLDLAVANGAAYYGMVRRGEGVRIASGLARSYYIGIGSESNTESASQALCVVPAGIEPGQEIDLSARTFELLVSQPIEFPLYVSSTRLTDPPGSVIAVDREQLTELPPIRTVLKSSGESATGTLQVALQARLTEIGTLDLWCAELSGKRTWKLLFDVRSATRTDIVAHDAIGEQRGFFDEATLNSAREFIRETFQPGSTALAERGERLSPTNLMKSLGETLQMSRDDWPPTLLRQLWETLLESEAGRKLGPQFEARWLNLLGFSLRPGYGMAVDDWRVAETWRTLQGRLMHGVAACRTEWWILWRRIAGGLSSGQQQTLTAPLISQAKPVLKAGKAKPNEFGASPHEAAEILRLIGSCESLAVSVRSDLGNAIVETLVKRHFPPLQDALWWTLGRLGARVPVYGPLNAVLPMESVAKWLPKLLEVAPLDSPAAQFALMQMTRKTSDRYRDVSPSLREKVVEWMTRAAAPQRFIALIQEGGSLAENDQATLVGEALPKGLRLL